LGLDPRLAVFPQLLAVLAKDAKKVCAEGADVEYEIGHTVYVFHREMRLGAPRYCKLNSLSLDPNVRCIIAVHEPIPQDIVQALGYDLKRAAG
jgi:hypothetical protein